MKMTRKKTEIKKIENINARQVTFCKRRGGLFKKAQELSTLCDAQIALIIFSATNKLFHYTTSSMQSVIERRNRYSAIQRLDNPPIEQQIYSVDMLRKEVADRTHELSQLNGEELQGLTMLELHKLEELLQRGLSTISKVKEKKIIHEINNLKTKGVELTEENQKLKQVQSFSQEQRQSSYKSITCSSSDLPLDSDTSFKFGLSLFK